MLKKITLGIIILFFVGVGGIYFLGQMYPDPADIPGAKPIAPNQQGLTAAVVATHNSATDCYLIVNNNVYDVTAYLGYHPGGKRQITSRCGKEASGVFASIHSNFAWDLLKNYKIGNLVSQTQTATEGADVFTKVQDTLKKKFPTAEIVNIKPIGKEFIAKIIFDGKLYEIHLDAEAQIIKQEVENDEFDWGTWDTDTDDIIK